MLSTEELLRKAVLSATAGDPGALAGSQTSDFDGAGQAPLSVEQVTEFIELLSAGQTMLKDVRQVTSTAAKWQESILDFGGRIAKPGTEATRLSDGDRAKPTTGKVEISTVLLRAEIPVSDETMEDQVAGPRIVNSIQRMIADQFGYDIEDLLVNDDGQAGGTWNSLLPNGGWLYNCKTNGNSLDATSYGQDYQEIFRALLEDMPDRFRRGLETDGRFYIPKRTEVKYRDILASRGTALGDMTLTGTGDLVYQGIRIVGVPTFGIDTNKSYFLLANRNNLYAGFHRAMTFETWRDPREGATSFIATARVDAEVAVPDATCIAYNVDVAV